MLISSILKFKNLTYEFHIVSFGIGILIFFISSDYGMFWDNVLFASKMGNELYFNSIFNWTMPNSFDPGHPPFLGFIQAVFWKLFGRSLWVSHLAMLPFTVGFIYQLFRFANYYVTKKSHLYFATLIIFADPTLSTSLVLVNPEIIILFFSLLAINGILYKRMLLKFTGFLFLSIISFRSMMLFGGFLLFDFINSIYIQKRKVKDFITAKNFIFYFIAALPGLTYVVWRLITKGWLQTHPDSPWATLWQFASIDQFLKNILILGHRYLDFGRVFIFIFLFFSLIYMGKKLKIKKELKQLLCLSFCSVIFVVITVLLSTNAFGHRYFIISYITFILIAFLLIVELKRFKNVIYIALLIGLITGNLWIYPEKISQGWDATLAHLPYHSLRKQAINYLEEQKITFENVGTFFPNYNTIDQIEINGDERKIDVFNSNQEYVVYSNVYNLTDNEYEVLDKKYEEIKRFEKSQIFVSILKVK